MEYNFEKAVGKIKKLAQNWRYRYLTIFGKMCVIQILMLPKLTHIAAILPNLPRKKIYEIQKICNKFLKLNKRPIVGSAKTLYLTNN